MPYLHNHTLDDLVLWELGRVVPADGRIPVTDEEAQRFDDHPHISVERGHARGKKSDSAPEKEPADPANDSKESD